MDRICTSLAEHGYEVTLVGRKLRSSLPLADKKFRQKRLRCWFSKGKWFYAEYNIRLFLFLLSRKMDAVCAIDLDTILACLKVSKWKKIPRIYDAHELFTELKEVLTRPGVLKTWSRIERKAVPQFKWAYTVSEGIAKEFQRRYGVKFETIRNVPVLKPLEKKGMGEFLLYQGAVNEARGFEWLIPAMKEVNAKLVIAGDGNFMSALKELIRENNVTEKIELKGMMKPEALRELASQARVGIALAEKEGLNQWLALPNKFIDYIHAALPQVTMNFPEYQKVNQQWEVAVLIDDLSSSNIARLLNNLMQDDVLLKKLSENCLEARKSLNWQQEEPKLLAFYQSVFAS